MSAAALLRKAEAAGLRLYVANGKLHGRGAEPTPELRAELAARGPELIAFLAPKPGLKQESEAFLRAVCRFFPGAKIVNQRAASRGNLKQASIVKGGANYD
jgi:hypothetical protein